MAKNREEYLKSKRETMQRIRDRDPKIARKKRNDFYYQNRESQKQKMREYYSRRFFWGRAMKLRSEDRATFKQVAVLWKKQKGRCALSGRRLDRTSQLDHINPKALGGGDRIENLQWVCKEINLAKRAMTDHQLIELCKDVMNWNYLKAEDDHE